MVDVNWSDGRWSEQKRGIDLPPLLVQIGIASPPSG